jgi:hypothetical protein
MSLSNQTGTVGMGSSNSTQYFNGSIDECGFFNTKLTGAQIATLYNNGNGITL